MTSRNEHWTRAQPEERREITEETRERLERLILLVGSIRAAGRVYDERFGKRPNTGERLIHRHLHEHVRWVTDEIADRLWVLSDV